MSDQFTVTWDDNDRSSRDSAMDQYASAGDSYTGVSKSTASHWRDFRDIEPNKTVRPGFTRNDYDAFRPDEQIPRRQKRIIKMCMDAYDKVGIIRNVVDLMGDFGSQGVEIVHENKSVESFYKQWFKKIDGKERSERFLNNLYRTGNVIIYRSDAKITPSVTKYIKSMGADIRVKVPKFEKGAIPWRYNFFNPTSIESKDGKLNIMFGRKDYQITSTSFVDNFRDGTIPAQFLETLPADVKNKIKKGDKKIPLDPERLSLFFYKKDDWMEWANPMIYAILDDIIMLEKMRLADLSALDGAISNVRLWTLGNLEHKILPTKAGINKVRDVLSGNSGGGTMELVWGPELTYTESNSQVYKFLGSEKYTSVLNSIYAGLGVPPTLTGLAGNGGGFTNNFISLKTLVERLQYGRELLIKFWEKEIEFVRQAMGFRKPAHIQFDQMSLSDEAAEKNLLIQLADRDIVSHETVLQRFKEIPSIEKIRLKREQKDRANDTYPDKAGPFHNPNHKQEMEKIDKQGEINKEVKDKQEKKKPVNPNGRPKLKQDEGPRKKRVETPKSKPGVAELIVWSQDAFDKISEVATKAFLGFKNKANLRKLTKAEVAELERIKLDILTNVELMSDVSDDVIYTVLSANKKAPVVFSDVLKDLNISTSNMSIDEYKKRAVGSFVQLIVDDKI
tara:strand:- start:8792 stop:10816 length:2025 start_codon:yes stop_codon:yes gene_type:complete